MEARPPTAHAAHTGECSRGSSTQQAWAGRWGHHTNGTQKFPATRDLTYRTGRAESRGNGEGGSGNSARAGRGPRLWEGSPCPPTGLVGLALPGVTPGPVSSGVEGRDADQVLGVAGEVLQLRRGLGQEQHPHLLRLVPAVRLPVVDLPERAGGWRPAREGRGGAPSVPQPGGRWPLSQRGPERSRGPSCALQSRRGLRPGQGGRGLRMEVAFRWHLLRLPGKYLFSHRAGCGGPAPSPKLLDRRETNLPPAPACG